jgi:CheY-like chemotaxis protein
MNLMTAAPLVLVVEDEALIRMMLSEVLDDAGFASVVVADGHRAISELEADATRFRAVVTDIRLGSSPSGWTIARRARELVPDMPVLYVSGDSAHEWAAQGVLGSVMVAKPYVVAQVVTALSMLLLQADRL